MGRNLQRLSHIPVTQYNKVVLRLFDQAAVVQYLGRDLVASVKAILDLCQADLDPLFPETIGEPSNPGRLL